jgi:ATP-dependent DNA helicase RecG
MPQEKDSPEDRLRKVVALERSRGYRDDAVIGGLEAFLRRNLPAALPIVAGYGTASHFERQRILARLLSEPIPEPAAEPPAAPGGDPLRAPVRTAKGVGDKRAESLERLGVQTIEDLLTYLPRRLEDRSRAVEIGRVVPGQEVGVRGEILAVNEIRPSPRMTVVKAAVGDGTGILYAAWFNQPWLAQSLRRGEVIDLFGKVEKSYGALQMSSPVWEPAGEGHEIGRLVPVYPATEGLSDKFLRSLIARNLDLYAGAFQDVVPEPVRRAHALLPKAEAIRTIHVPKDPEAFERARRSLAFEELFLLQLGLAALPAVAAGKAHAGTGQLATSFLAALPFTLTPGQRAALGEIVADLRAEKRMMRLLQGDVGSGKTIVALASALYAIEAGYQAAFMVPTELLAEQHAVGFERLLAGLPVRVALLTSARSGKDDLKERVRTGEVDLVVGTHALIEEDVAFANLGFVVIDEQHRFGVVQRSRIEEKGKDVDLLVMSATPIPRTIALTLYGEFEVSLMTDLPHGTAATRTVWVAETRRGEVYREVRRLLEAGGKGYVVLPLVEESEKVDLKAAVEVAEELTASLGSFGVGLVHGKLPTKERTRAMEAFREGSVRLLVATTVIEVGIDVLDADFMVIEHAERFGLSQLHQLRGRIGRKGQAATCFAVGDARSEEAQRRLAAFSTHNDGFALAEEDLSIRGPGDLLGTQQHGFLDQFRAVDLLRDLPLMVEAREDARALLRDGLAAPLMPEVDRRFGEVLKWLRV